MIGETLYIFKKNQKDRPCFGEWNTANGGATTVAAESTRVGNQEQQSASTGVHHRYAHIIL